MDTDMSWNEKLRLHHSQPGNHNSSMSSGVLVSYDITVLFAEPSSTLRMCRIMIHVIVVNYWYKCCFTGGFGIFSVQQTRQKNFISSSKFALFSSIVCWILHVYRAVTPISLHSFQLLKQLGDYNKSNIKCSNRTTQYINLFY